MLPRMRCSWLEKSPKFSLVAASIVSLIQITFRPNMRNLSFSLSLLLSLYICVYIYIDRLVMPMRRGSRRIPKVWLGPWNFLSPGLEFRPMNPDFLFLCRSINALHCLQYTPRPRGNLWTVFYSLGYCCYIDWGCMKK